MATRSIKSSFFVRKSSRLSGRSSKSLKEGAAGKQKCPDFDYIEEPAKKSASTVTAALKNVFHKKERKRDDRAEGTDFEQMLSVRNNKSPAGPGSPPYTPNSTVMKACCGVTSSPESNSLLPSTPSSNMTSAAATPIQPRPALSAEELTQACKRLLSPSKRKSDEEDSENVFVHCALSPVKSPRSSPTERHVPQAKVSTPSIDLVKSSLSPSTPQSNVRANTSRSSRIPTSTPRRLFTSPEKKSRDNYATPVKASNSSRLLTPFNTPSTPKHKSGAKPYQSAKRSLHTAKPDRLIGREEETQQLEDFVSERLEDGASGSLYVSGPPGTGKTAVITQVVDNLKSKFSNMKCAFLNCMTLKDTNAVFSHIHEQLKGSPVKGRDAMKAMEKYLTTSGASVLLILDEIDQLDSKHQDVLYRIFEWPTLKNSRLVLVGIANALDLTDRVLPRLQASAHCRPTLINFAPYTSVQITDILKHRLERESVVEPNAINFCARKVSAVAGDARKALDVCRRAVEIVEADVRSQAVLKPQDCNSPTKSRGPGGDGTPIKKVTLAHISRVMNEVYGNKMNTSSSDSSKGDNDIPLQQKLAVCSLLVLLRAGKLKEVLLGKLHDAYSRVCRKQQVAPVDQAEFHSILGLLDARGVVALKKAKDTRSIKVSLNLDEQELETTLQDKLLMATILKDGIPK